MIAQHLSLLPALAALAILAPSPRAAAEGAESSPGAETEPAANPNPAAAPEAEPEAEPEAGTAATAEAQERIAGEAEAELARRRDDIVAEAADALDETGQAVGALAEGDAEAALAALERATGKLELILVRRPDLALASVDATMEVVEFLADAQGLRDVTWAAEQSFISGRVQVARSLLRDFASETVVRVTSLPMATYPDALKEAARLVDAGSLDEAALVLGGALGTLVITETVYPHPLIDAEVHLEAARALAEAADRTAAEEDQLAAALEGARLSLERAEAFGYGTSRDFRDLYDAIREIEHATSDGGGIAGLFAGLRESLAGVIAGASDDLLR